MTQQGLNKEQIFVTPKKTTLNKWEIKCLLVYFLGLVNIIFKTKYSGTERKNKGR